MNQLHKLDYKSPIGIIEIIGTGEAIYSIMFKNTDILANIRNGETPKILEDCYWQLDEYFKGCRHEFNLPFIYEGTNFEKNVWNALSSISYGKTVSYKDIAVLIGNEKAVRAVGSANGKNKLSILIPCHRIIGSNGKLTGYAGGLWRKEWLLQHEKAIFVPNGKC